MGIYAMILGVILQALVLFGMVCAVIWRVIKCILDNNNEHQKTNMRVTGVEKSVEKIEKRVDNIESRVENVEGFFEKVEVRVDNVEAIVNKEQEKATRINVWRGKVCSHINSLNKKLKSQEKRFTPQKLKDIKKPKDNSTNTHKVFRSQARVNLPEIESKLSSISIEDVIAIFPKEVADLLSELVVLENGKKMVRLYVIMCIETIFKQNKLSQSTLPEDEPSSNINKVYRHIN